MLPHEKQVQDNYTYVAIKRTCRRFLMYIDINDINAPELDVYSRLSEPQLLRYYEPAPGLFIAETPMVLERALDAGYEPVSVLVDRSQLKGHLAVIIERTQLKSNRTGSIVPEQLQDDQTGSSMPAQQQDDQVRDIPVYVGDEATLASLTGFKLTRGVLCCMKRRPLPGVEEVLGIPSGSSGASGSSDEIPTPHTLPRRIVVLEDVMNPVNVGSIFRSAAALGIDAILLTHGSSDPLYRRALRVGMGTPFMIPWTYLPEDISRQSLETHGYIDRLHALGYKTVAMALRDDSISLDDPVLRSEPRLAIIMGTEGDGLADLTIADSDYTVRIPMKHGVDSLNVAAAAAVALYELVK